MVWSVGLAASVAAVMLLLTPDVGLEPTAPTLSAQHTPALRSTESLAPQDLSVAGAAGSSLAELEASAGSVPDPYLIQHLTHADAGPMRTLSSNVRLASYERP